MASLPFFLGSADLLFERLTLLKHAFPAQRMVGMNEPLLAEYWVHFERVCGLSQGSEESWSLPPQEWAQPYGSEPGVLGQGRGVAESPVPARWGDYLTRPQFSHIQNYRLYVFPRVSTGICGYYSLMPQFSCFWYYTYGLS